MEIPGNSTFKKRIDREWMELKENSTLKQQIRFWKDNASKTNDFDVLMNVSQMSRRI